jgi:hypothetical protein
MSAPLRPLDLLARFLLQRSHFNLNQQVVKPIAFLPPGDLRTSVFRTYDLSDDEIWTLGLDRVAYPSGRTLYGRAELNVASVMSVGLQVEADDVPLRHASICGWPREKDHQKSLAQELAANAVLKLRDDATA